MEEIKSYFIKKGGKAIHKLGDISRNVLDAELIYVNDEDEDNYIGHFAEGYGFIDVKFAKEDCRPASAKEEKEWIKDKYNFKF